MISRIIILAISLSAFNVFAQPEIIINSSKKLNVLKTQSHRSVNLKPFVKDSAHKRGLNNTYEYNNAGAVDTLSYTHLGEMNTDFGFHGQDVMMQYFVAPADMIIKGIGFSCSDNSGTANGTSIGLRLIKFNWNYSTLDSINSDIYLGHYSSIDSASTINYFGEKADENWVDKTNGVYPNPPWVNKDYDLWSDSLNWVNIVPVKQETAGSYQWIDALTLGFEPQVAYGEVFAVAAKNNSTILGEDRIGFYAANAVGPNGWKYYANGRTDSTDFGWWIRNYTWDFALAVELVGGPGTYRFYDYSILNTTLSTEPRYVETKVDGFELTNDLPLNVYLHYSINNGEFELIEMDSLGHKRYGSSIPGQNPGDFVRYYFEAVDSKGVSGKSQEFQYKIFKVENQQALVIFNGQSESGYPQDYYFGHDDFINFTTIDFPHDVWAYGKPTLSLLNNYETIFEFTTQGPEFYQNENIRNWLESNSNRNYFLAGQEWFGLQNGFVDSNYLPGTFEYDILGIKESYNDVSYADSTGYKIPSKFILIQKSLLGNKLYEKFMGNGPTDSLKYDPVYELATINNWIDAFEVVDSNNIDLKVETRGIAGERSIQIKPCAVHNILPNGNKIVFLAFDPISINSSPKYYWYGFSESSLQVQSLQWFGLLDEVEEDDNLTQQNFNLSQNYPNPFNPKTTIHYTIPSLSVISVPQGDERSFTSKISPSGRNDRMHVKLKVYDVLGREVTTLENKEQKPGTYKVVWNASNYPSGVYFYRLTSGEYFETKKMILLR